MEVYIRGVIGGDIKDGNRFVGESDLARSFRRQKPEAGEHYVRAISSIAGTYKRLSDTGIQDLDQVIVKAVHQQTIALELEDEQSIASRNVHGKRHRNAPSL